MAYGDRILAMVQGALCEGALCEDNDRWQWRVAAIASRPDRIHNAQQRNTPDCVVDAIRQPANSDRSEKDDQAALTAIFFSAFCASVLFGSVTVSTPFLKLASILPVSTPSGT